MWGLWCPLSNPIKLHCVELKNLDHFPNLRETIQDDKHTEHSHLIQLSYGDLHRLQHETTHYEACLYCVLPNCYSTHRGTFRKDSSAVGEDEKKLVHQGPVSCGSALPALAEQCLCSMQHLCTETMSICKELTSLAHLLRGQNLSLTERSSNFVLHWRM